MWHIWSFNTFPHNNTDLNHSQFVGYNTNCWRNFCWNFKNKTIGLAFWAWFTSHNDKCDFWLYFLLYYFWRDIVTFFQARRHHIPIYFLSFCLINSRTSHWVQQASLCLPKFSSLICPQPQLITPVICQTVTSDCRIVDDSFRPESFFSLCLACNGQT